MKIKLEFCGLLILLAYCVVMPAAERQIKKPKIDDVITTSILCTCTWCTSIRLEALQCEDRDCVIALALLTTKLDKDCINIIHSYMDRSYMDCSYKDCFWSWNLQDQKLIFKEQNQQVSNLVLADGEIFNYWKNLSWRAKSAIHVVPQESFFYHAAMEEGIKLVFNNEGDKTKKMILDSLCQRYRLNLSFKKVMVSICAPRLSESAGWKKAFAELSR